MALARSDPNLNPCSRLRRLSPRLDGPSCPARASDPSTRQTRHPFNMDDIQCSDSFSDCEMLDGISHSQIDERSFSPHIIDAANRSSSKQDHDISPAVHVSRNPTASRSPSSSQGLERDYENAFSSRLHSLSGQQQVASANSPGDVTLTVGTSVLTRIESIFEAMADVLLNERGQLSVELATRPRTHKQHPDSADSDPAKCNHVQRLCFPGKSEREAWRFGEAAPLHQHVRPLTIYSRCYSHLGAGA